MGWIIFLLGTIFDFHLVKLLDAMVVTPSSPSDMEGTQLLSTASLFPAWTKVDLDTYLQKDRPLLVQWFSSSKVKPNRQDTLYWMEHGGPKLYQILFQIQMLFTSAYTSLLCLNLLPFMCIHSEQTLLERWGFAIVSLLPVYLVLSKYQAAAANMTMACSIGVHRKPHAVAEVALDEKTEHVIMSLVMMQKLAQAVEGGNYSTTTTPTSFTQSEIRQANAAFDSLDGSGDGHISADELGKLFQALGTTPPKKTMDAIVAALDKDKSGSIDKEEFLAFFKTYILTDLDHHGIHQLAKDMFAKLDRDGSGEITLSEFKGIIDALDVGFTVDDIGALVNELDEKDNGTISEHELVHLLLVRHHNLFQHACLPELE